jgi:ABC-type transport system involved in cytochrome bd biosynthesis fused ATPase/permease subunit
LYQTPKNDQASLLNEKFWKVYKEQKKLSTKDNYSHFLRTLWILVKPTFVPAGFCQLFALSSQLSFPMCVMKLLQAVENDGNIVQETLPCVVAIFFLSIINALCTHRYQILSYQSGIIIRTAMTCAIYEQSLNLSPKGRSGGLTYGNVTNLVATDTQKLFDVFHELHQIWSCPLAILIVVIMLFVIIGPSCLVGAFILIGLVPLSKKVRVMLYANAWY